MHGVWVEGDGEYEPSSAGLDVGGESDFTGRHVPLIHLVPQPSRLVRCAGDSRAGRIAAGHGMNQQH